MQLLSGYNRLGDFLFNQNSQRCIRDELLTNISLHCEDACHADEQYFSCTVHLMYRLLENYESRSYAATFYVTCCCGVSDVQQLSLLLAEQAHLNR